MMPRPPLIRTCAAAIGLVAFLAVPALARPQAPAPTGADVVSLEQAAITAPVMIDGAAVLRVRGVSSFSAEQRARAIADRILGIAADGTVQPDAVRLEETEFATQIMAGRHLVMGVYEADATIEGVPRRYSPN